MKLLSRIEEIILVSIWRLGDNAYGMPIRDEVIQATGKDWLLGAIYGPLGRLHKNGYIDPIKGEPTAERGGRAKVFYTLTPIGMKALEEIQRVNSYLWQNIPDFSTNGSHS
ncbi:PadR family transcriptional regulator [bacterium]|nr:PadR family transcriptional regulator [bacterium]